MNIHLPYWFTDAEIDFVIESLENNTKVLVDKIRKTILDHDLDHEHKLDERSEVYMSELFKEQPVRRPQRKAATAKPAARRGRPPKAKK